MTNYVQLTDLQAPAGAASATLLPASGDTLLVKAGVVVSNSNVLANATAILCSSTFQTVFLDGTAFGERGIRAAFGTTNVYVGATGHCVGSFVGVDFAGGGNRLVNSGQITGHGASVRSEGSLLFQNTGTVDAAGNCIQLNSGPLDLRNDGTIAGQSYSVLAANGDFDDLIVNTGTMIGEISLFNGDDLYDGSMGRLTGIARMWEGNDTFLGGVDNETVLGGGGSDEIDTGGGNDVVYVDFDYAADTLDGGDGIDMLDASATNPSFVRVNLTTGILRGSDTGTDLITGFEHVRGTLGNDAITGDAAANRLWGDNGNDTLLGGSGNDRLDGGANIDRLDGGEGNDRLIGRDGTDTLLGGTGNDTIGGGNGIDLLTGGGGTDLFVFNTREEINTLFEFSSGIIERITDFNTNGDIIDLSGIDRDSATVADDSFTFVGGAAITGAGQVAVRQSGGNTFIDLSFSSSTVVARIQLDGLVSVDANDFVL